MHKYIEAREILIKYKQDNILNELEKNKNENLIKQILEIDFKQINKIYADAIKEKVFVNDKIEHIKYIDANKISEEEKSEYYNIGKKIISKGKYAIVTMAGGQRN